ncbi:MAG: hypothetical protein LBO79_06945 [Zoogloeaceae bacterium]|jgi:tetratricopeptide (TPR) repeat protein|nr:hypothetical protein [Zoogloeaceae bacterium]
MNHPYYIFAPDYVSNSEGIRSLHYLCDALNRVGHEAWVFYADILNPDLNTPKLTLETCEKHVSENRAAIGVYPEVVSDNLMDTPVAVHWMLNREMTVRGNKINAREEDLFFYYSPTFTPNRKEKFDFLCTFPRLFDFELFKPDPSRAKENPLLYINRIPESEIDFSALPPDIEFLSNRRPLSLPRLAEKLQGAPLLYTYEYTGTCTLAMLCGCPVIALRHPNYPQYGFTEKIVATYPFKAYAFSDTPENVEQARKALPGIRETLLASERAFQRQLERFIQKTQAAANSTTRRSHLPPKLRFFALESKNAPYLKEAMVKISASSTPEACLEMAISAFGGREFEKAIMLLSPLLDELPENPLPPAYLAFICVERGFIREAEDFMRKASGIAPQRADLKAAMGEVLLKSGQPTRATAILQEAVSLQPDLFWAYPALAKGLLLTHRGNEAVSLLQSAASIPSPAQDNIQSVLLEILIQQGDLGEFARMNARFSRGLADDLLTVRALAHFEADGARLLETLGGAQQQLADACADDKTADNLGDGAPGIPASARAPLKIAFLVGDFAREERLRRLPALLRDLPPEDFTTFLLIHDPQHERNDCASLCGLLADQHWLVHERNDADTLDILRKIAPDILIDLEAYGPAERLAVFLKADAPRKFLWGEAPMPPLSPECQVLTGARLAKSSVLPCVTLPEMGEYCALPELPITAPPTIPASGKETVFGVLTPARRIDREGWRQFAEVLKARPGSQLLINLEDLGEIAQEFICGVFAGAGIAAERLRFVHAHTEENLCRLWQETDMGLAPPTDAGDLALPACLWMGRPCLVLASPLPWSCRPAALLELAGAEEWLCQSPEDYLERARQTPPAPNPQFRARMKAAGLDNPRVFAQGFARSMLQSMSMPATGRHNAEGARPSPA